jgi:hypothetical protein
MEGDASDVGRICSGRSFQRMLSVTGLTLLLAWSRVIGVADFAGWPPLVALVEPPWTVQIGFLVSVFVLLFGDTVRSRWRGATTTVGTLLTLAGYGLFLDLILFGVFSCAEGLGAGGGLSVGVPTWQTDGRLFEYRLRNLGVEISYGDCSTWVDGFEVVAGWTLVAAGAVVDR